VPPFILQHNKMKSKQQLHITVGRQNQRFTKRCISLKVMQERWHGIC